MFSVRKHSIHLLDRGGVAPVNLARNQFTQPDIEITDAIRKRAQDDIMSQIYSIRLTDKKPRQELLGILNKCGLFYYNGGVCPIDAHILQTSDIFKVYNLPSKTYDIEISKRVRDVAFSFAGHISGVLKTEFLERVRSINLDSKHHSRAIVFAKTDLVHSLKSGNIPQWLELKVNSARKIIRGGNDFSLLLWGSATDEDIDNISILSENLNIDYAEYFEFTRWNDKQRWDQFENSQTEFSKFWIKEFSSTKSVYYPKA